METYTSIEDSSESVPVLTEDPCLGESLSVCVQTLGLPQITRHLFLCADQSVAKCCSKEEGLQTWNHLKKRLQALGLDRPTRDRPTCTFRTKANCLRVCQQGPILVVYPDGVWYCRVTPAVVDRIIQEHLLQNTVVEEHIFLIHPLPDPSPAPRLSEENLQES
jgi:(2Fe-2S) ferredoxin